MKKIKLIAIIVATVTISSLGFLVNKYRTQLKTEKQNSHALLLGVSELKNKNEQYGVEVNALQLSLSQYKKYRAEQADSLKKMGVKLKNLEMVAKHQMEVNAQLKGTVRDSIKYIVHDSILVPQKVQYIEVYDKFLQMTGVVNDKEFLGTIKLPVNIIQTVEAKYRRKFLWWRWGLEGFNQKVMSDNPYVKIKYSEFIKVK